MGMFNHIGGEEDTTFHPRICALPFFLNYQRKTTDSGLFRWVVVNKQRGFRTDDENAIVLRNCALISTVDGIKHKGGLAEIKMKINGIIVKSYSEDSNKKLKSLRLTFAGEFNKNDKINIETKNVTEVQLTIYGQQS